MTEQLSFNSQEQEARSHFREMMAQAESTEDVKKFFYQTVRDLLKGVCDTLPVCNIQDIQLDLKKGKGYHISESLMDGAGLPDLMQRSDLDAILTRLADKAWNRYRHLEKNHSKTEQKIYPSPGR